MRKLSLNLLWLYVFTLSWDTVSLPFIGSLSRATGMTVIFVAVLGTVMRGHVRKPDSILVFALAFSGWSALSLLWTVSYPLTLVRVYTYLQVVASVWLIREVVRSRDQAESLMTAFCFGLFVPLAGMLQDFNAGVASRESRFTASDLDLNPNMLGIFVVIGIPMAWHLIMNRRGIVRALAMLYFAVAPLSLLLTASRGAFLAGITAFLIVPLTLLRRGSRTYVAGGLLVAAIVSAVVFVPDANWDRISSISTELTEGGTMSGRTEVWKAGLERYPERPILGFGAATYAVVTAPYRGRALNSHNTAIGLLVEEGFVGLVLFAAVLAACAWAIFFLPRSYRVLWSIIMLTWFVGAMDGNWEHVKMTWVLIGLISAQRALKGSAAQAAAKGQDRVTRIATQGLPTRSLPHIQRI